MTAIISPDLQKHITSKYLFLDSDFLNEIYKDEDLFSQFTSLVYGFSYPMIDPLIEFEFSRSVTSPKEAVKMDKFVKSEIFTPVSRNQEIFVKIQDNAFILSKIYALHSNGDAGKHASLVDLFLAGRLMTYSSGVACVITGNTRDYPGCIFDVLGVITKYQKDSRLQSFGILTLNQDKFRDEYQRLEKALNSN